MSDENKNNKTWMEYFRLFTPFMLIVFSFVGWSVNIRISELERKITLIDEKIFTHLTNEEIHTPRGFLVSQESFTLYQSMRDKEIQVISDNVCEIKRILEKEK